MPWVVLKTRATTKCANTPRSDFQGSGKKGNRQAIFWSGPIFLTLLWNNGVIRGILIARFSVVASG